MAGRYYNRQGGVSRCLAELSDRAARGDEVTVFAHEILDRRESTASFNEVAMISRPHWVQIPTFSLALSRGLRPDDFDLVHVHGPQGFGADVYTAHSCHHAYIAQRRAEGGPGALLSRVYPPHVTALRWERRCFTDPNAVVIALTDLVRSELEQHLSVDPRRIRVIGNGVDTKAFQPAASTQEARRAVEATVRPHSDDSIVLLFVGYEFHRKGLARIIEAMGRMEDDRLEAWVVGGDEPAPYRRLASSVGVGERVKFLGHQRDPAEFFRGADAFVLPTAYEAFPLVLLEALACGTPVITTTKAGGADAIRYGEEGYVLERPDDPEQLRGALDSLVAARDRWPQMRAAARALAERYDWEVVWHRTRSLYEQVLAAKRAGLERWREAG